MLQTLPGRTMRSQSHQRRPSSPDPTRWASTTQSRSQQDTAWKWCRSPATQSTWRSSPQSSHKYHLEENRTQTQKEETFRRLKTISIWIAMCSMASFFLFVSVYDKRCLVSSSAYPKAASRTRPGPMTSSAGWGSSARAGETPAGWRRAHWAPGLQTYNRAKDQASWIHPKNVNCMPTRNRQLSHRKEIVSLTDWLAFQEVDIVKHLPVFGP